MSAVPRVARPHHQARIARPPGSGRSCPSRWALSGSRAACRNAGTSARAVHACRLSTRVRNSRSSWWWHRPAWWRRRARGPPQHSDTLGTAWSKWTYPLARRGNGASLIRPSLVGQPLSEAWRKTHDIPGDLVPTGRRYEGPLRRSADDRAQMVEFRLHCGHALDVSLVLSFELLDLLQTDLQRCVQVGGLDLGRWFLGAASHRTSGHVRWPTVVQQLRRGHFDDARPPAARRSVRGLRRRSEPVRRSGLSRTVGADVWRSSNASRSSVVGGGEVFCGASARMALRSDIVLYGSVVQWGSRAEVQDGGQVRHTNTPDFHSWASPPDDEWRNRTATHASSGVAGSERPSLAAASGTGRRVSGPPGQLRFFSCSRSTSLTTAFSVRSIRATRSEQAFRSSFTVFNSNCRNASCLRRGPMRRFRFLVGTWRGV